MCIRDRLGAVQYVLHRPADTVVIIIVRLSHNDVIRIDRINRNPGIMQRIEPVSYTHLYARIGSFAGALLGRRNPYGPG